MREWPHVLRDHVNRYAFALPYVAGRSVCDVGCGTGYGAFLMSMVARGVTGCDISGAAIEFAQNNFGSRCVFVQSDVTAKIPFTTDVYTCFEVLEHVDDPQTILANIPQGATLIWSVPINDPGQFHKRVYQQWDAAALVPNSRIYVQLENGEVIEDMKTHGHIGATKYIVGVRKGDK
jgi:ubiquinone/menaquinone biosynthesis C-methylase UbiE